MFQTQLVKMIDSRSRVIALVGCLVIRLLSAGRAGYFQGAKIGFRIYLPAGRRLETLRRARPRA